MIVTLSFNSLNGEIVSGIPRFVEIESSSPATIFYTLDGTLPTQLSNVYTDPIELPTEETSVSLSAVGYFLDGYSNLVPTPILSNVYSPDVSEIKKTRYFFFEGVVYMYPGGLEIPFWYDHDGYASVFIDILPEELENILILSDRNADGSDRSTTNETKRIPADKTSTLLDNDFQIYDTPSSNVFNPEALFILIDGRNPTDLDDVLLINGPHLDLRDPRKNFSGLDFYSNQNTIYRSGNFTRYFFDRVKGTIVFYYFCSNTGRWVKSIQNLPEKDTSTLAKPTISNPVVFEWFNFGRHSGY